MRRLLNVTFLILVLVSSAHCWWPWGGEEEVVEDEKENKEEGKEEGGFKEQLERDLAGLGRQSDSPPDVVDQKEKGVIEKEKLEETKEEPKSRSTETKPLKPEKENRLSEADKVLSEVNNNGMSEEDNKNNNDNNNRLSEADEAKVAALLETPELAKQLDRKAFEEKLDEVIKRHEALHSGKEAHFDEGGEHNAEYDHEAFLGDEAGQFASLTPEQARVKLGLVVDKIDGDNDTLITEAELTKWIKETAQRSVDRRTEEFWSRNNPGGELEISWDKYRAIQYGFLTDNHITDQEGRWKGEEDVDEETLAIYKQLELRDRRRWTVADRNKNLQLSKEEFAAFIHPEHAEHMGDILISETMADFDQDGDGKLDLAEYVKNIFGDTKEVADWDNGGIQFRSWRDLDHDGFIDKAELRSWMMPEEYDQHQAEASHLIHEADRNGDGMLSKMEVLESQGIFVASQATDFGDDLHYHHDEL